MIDPLRLLWQRQLSVFHIRMAGCGGCARLLDDELLRAREYSYALECPSPRHADLIVVTGCWTKVLGETALGIIEQALAGRSLLLAGDCAIGRGLIPELLGVTDNVGLHTATDIRVQGCPVSIEAVAREVRNVTR